MTIETKQAVCSVTGFKAADDGSMKFTCYGNVKGNVDHALDKTMNGAYLDSIKRHKSDGTMPKMFWSHNPAKPPIGVWLDMEEDERGLKMTGEFLDTPRGRELYEAYKKGAIDSFSIGYNVIEEKWNQLEGYNELHKIHVVEVSCVNFACNEESRLVGIKSKLDNDELPTKRELEKFLRENGLSRKEAERITSRYDDTKSSNVLESIASLWDTDQQP